MFIEPGEVYLSESLIGSRIFGGGEGGQPNQGLGNLEEDDPELAAAIRMSLEENQANLHQAPPQAQAPAPAQAPQVPQPQPTQQEKKEQS